MMDAIDKDDVTTIHQILNNHQKIMGTITPHIKHAQLQRIYVERFDEFSKLVTCMNEGKCGYRAYFHFLSACIYPLKTLFTSMAD